jgi:drug/metabolite transporter (DMT)-like permease
LLTVAVLGGLSFGANQILFPTGLALTTAANGALLVGTSPLLVMLVSSVIRTEQITLTKLTGALVSLVGVALVVTAGGSLSIGDRLLGDVLVLGAALSWATYIGLSPLILRAVPPLLATGWAMVTACVVILPLGAFQLATAWKEVRTEDFVAVTYTGLANGLGNALVFLAVQQLGATRVTQMQFLIPGLVVVLASMFLAEPIVVSQIAGGALIIVGIAWARRRRGLVVSTDPASVSDTGRRAGGNGDTPDGVPLGASESNEARRP